MEDRVVTGYYRRILGVHVLSVPVPRDRVLDRMASGSNPPRVRGQQASHLLSCENAKWNFLILSQWCTFLKKGKKNPFALPVPQFSSL